MDSETQADDGAELGLFSAEYLWKRFFEVAVWNDFKEK